jgi:hypothetical protein
VTSARRPVLLHANPRTGPPTSWEGAYSATVTPNVGEYGISSYNRTGQVVFELDYVEDGWLQYALAPALHFTVRLRQGDWSRIVPNGCCGVMSLKMVAWRR